tara:strand:- start:168 stop:605 length:438 start_codon:yes stop_codon:yes gene_type:complete
LVGLVVSLIFYTLVLDGEPYKELVEDRMQTMATACTVLMLLIGLTLKMSSQAKQKIVDGVSTRGDYDTAMLDIILVVLFGCVVLCGIGMLMMSCPCCASQKKKEGTVEATRLTVKSSSQVNEDQKSVEARNVPVLTSKEIKDWGK